MKKLTAIILTAALVAALAGCAQQSTQVAPVGFDAAKAAALSAAGVKAEEANFEEASLKEYKGHQYYEIEFDANGKEFEYYIEALTGTVITPELAAEVLSGNIQIPSGEKTVEPKAEAANAEVSKNEEVKAETPGSEAPKAEEVKAEAPKAAQPKAEVPKADSQLIGESKAKSIAISHAGKKETDITLVKCELDRDDGRVVYEVEFYSKDYIEYDYDIDAYSGSVLSYDYDVEDYKKPEAAKPVAKPTEKPSSNSSSTSKISEAEAKKIALAQVPGAKESDIR